MRYLSIIIVLLTLNNLAFSQTVEIKKATGISEFNAVNTICDNSGSILISGNSDLIKISNGNFEYLPCPFGNKSTKSTIALAHDANGNIWTSTDDGFVGKYNGSTWETWENIGNEFTYITAFAFDKYNNVWGAGGNKVYKYNGSAWTVYLPTIPFSNHVNNIICEQDTVWMASDGIGLVKFYGSNWETFPINGLSDKNTGISLAMDKQGNKWVSTTDFGVGKFNSESWDSYPETEYPQLADLKRIYFDSEGLLWVCSSTKGLSYFNDNDWSSINFNSGLFTNNYTALVSDFDKNQWFCSNNGVSFFDGKNITNYLSDSELPGDYLATLLFDSNDRIWISTFDGTTILDSLDSGAGLLNSELKNTYLTVIVEDLNGTIWAGSNEGVWMMKDGSWTKFTTDDGLVNNTINDIAVDSENNKWFATIGGISRFDDYQWINYGETDGISSASVDYIKVNNVLEVWVAAFSKDNTVSVFNGQYWNTLDPGLGEENYILAMEIDLDNNLWLGTTNGLYGYDGTNWSIFFNDTTPDSAISNISVDAMNNLIFLQDTKSMVKFNGAELSSFAEFENFLGKISFDNRGYAWGNNGEMLHRSSNPEPYLKLPMRYVYFKDYVEHLSFKLIASNTQWNIESDQNWLFVDVASGQGNENITITTMLDFFPEPVREATLSISGTGIYTQKINVYQQASAATEISDNKIGKSFKLIRQNNNYYVEGDDFSSLEVYAINGSKLYESSIASFNSSNFKNGMYLIKINDIKSSFETHKIIIAK